MFALWILTVYSLLLYMTISFSCLWVLFVSSFVKTSRWLLDSAKNTCQCPGCRYSVESGVHYMTPKDGTTSLDELNACVFQTTKQKYLRVVVSVVLLGHKQLGI